MSAPREQWTSKLAFVLAAAGSAVGLGNIWRFSYVVGTNGGAAFVFMYLVIIAVIGYPMMVTEVTLGQKAHKDPIGTFKALAPDTPWWLVGAMGVMAGFIILSFYSVVGGWSLAYVFKTFTGALGAGTDFGGEFVGLIGSAGQPIFWHALFMLLTIGIIAAGVVNGISRSVRILMPALFVLLLILVIRSVTLPGAGAGIAFYLRPDFSELNAQSLLAAVGQAFFTLSLGMGAMITYGSYLNDKEDIPDNAGWVVGLDTFIALLAGFAIFPAVFALGQDPGAGAGLAFITLPAVFAEIPAGLLFGGLFFLLLSVAALTSAISLLEVVVAWIIDEHEWVRWKAALVLGGIIFLLGIPASLSLGAADITVIGMPFFDFLDFLQESILLPLGGLLTSIFAGYVWKAKRTRDAANANAKKLKLGWWFDVLIMYVVPVAIALVMMFGLVDQYPIMAWVFAAGFGTAIFFTILYHVIKAAIKNSRPMN
ncbi:sodium-dependent transporter [Spirochaeta africana]|uniref:SNF family Na+-dependent transporter n=1 Tax=Spirochaeta africana (strain ATCC 700263 / DSM 8902 / Z-7692) TaxID=889378 RepID=H9UL81_SPIAZ|nr:sodium-dependent transporter [Spirochaeta africana]AFG38274.1 SNF family Na+-dependent transporter [Spirochaeta africana DSM 8902]